MGLTDSGSRRLMATVAVVAVLVLAGCSSFGGGSADTADGDSPANNTDTRGESPATNGSTAVDSLSDALASGPETRESYTATIDTSISQNGTTVVENTTVEVGAGGTAYAETVREVMGPNASTVVTESYTASNVTLSRYTTMEANVSSYDATRAGVDDLTGIDGFASQFEFSHEQTGDGTHRFTADSADQVVGEMPGEAVEDVSVVVIVESGIVTDLQYDLTVSTDSGTVEYHTDRTVIDRGSTTVTEPDWLQTARERTASPSSNN